MYIDKVERIWYYVHILASRLGRTNFKRSFGGRWVENSERGLKAADKVT